MSKKWIVGTEGVMRFVGPIVSKVARLKKFSRSYDWGGISRDINSRSGANVDFYGAIPLRSVNLRFGIKNYKCYSFLLNFLASFNPAIFLTDNAYSFLLL